MQNIARKLVVLGTGGTIAGTAADRVRPHRLPRPAAWRSPTLLQRLPGFGGDAIESEQVAQLDSKDMDHATWQRLARRVAAPPGARRGRRPS